MMTRVDTTGSASVYQDSFRESGDRRMRRIPDILAQSGRELLP